MNTAKANAIPMPEIMQKIGLKPVHTDGANLIYLSPISEEDKPGFTVNTTENSWTDKASDMSGNVLGFICSYLESNKKPAAPEDVLRWLQEELLDIQPAPRRRRRITKKIYALQRRGPIKSKYLCQFLETKGIPLELAQRYLQELCIHCDETGKTFRALGRHNIDGGFVFRNKRDKGSTQPENISFIRGRKTSGDHIHVFEDMFDFLSAVCYQKGWKFDGDAIILNGMKPSDAYPFIKNFTYHNVFTWFSNTKDGDKLTAAFAEFTEVEKLKHSPGKKLYADHKSVNAWHLYKRARKKVTEGEKA